MVPPFSPHTVSPPYTFSVCFAGNYWWHFPENIIYQAACCTKKLESCWFSFGTSFQTATLSIVYCPGHGKIETMGALAISSLLLVTGGGIAWHAIETIQACLHTILLNSGAFPEKIIIMCSGLAKVHLYAEILKCILYL
jgi:hypothetical protein